MLQPIRFQCIGVWISAEVSRIYVCGCTVSSYLRKIRLAPAFAARNSCVFFVKGPAAEATDAPHPWGLLCNPVKKMIKNFLFSFFLVMGHRWNEIDRGKPKYSGEKLVPVPLYPPQIPHGLTRDRTRASAVRGRRLTAWAMKKDNCCVDGEVRILSPLNKRNI
jgi:hypothetical protein